jgi:hypothetical protein
VLGFVAPWLIKVSVSGLARTQGIRWLGWRGCSKLRWRAEPGSMCAMGTSGLVGEFVKGFWVASRING